MTTSSAPPSAPSNDASSAATSPAVTKLLRCRYVVIAAVALVAPILAVVQLGRIHPDELFQTLEPAFHKVHGFGVLAWEWQLPQGGIRNWITPSVFAGILWLASKLGIDDPRTYRALCELPVLLLHGWMLVAVYRYAERRVGAAWALGAPVLVGLSAVVLTFGGRTMGETFSAALLVVAFEALDRSAPEQARRAGLIGGLALGFSVVTRYGSAVMVISALGYLLAQRQWRKLLYTLAAGASVLALLTAVDWYTWGKPLHSIFAYLQFNVLSNAAAQNFGESPWHFYLPVLAGALPVWLWPGLVGALWLQRPRVPLALVAAVLYVAAICATAHKEPRFLYPAILFLSFAAAPGLLGLLSKAPAKLGLALAALALLTTFRPPKVVDELQVQRPDQFQAQVRATRGDATGLLIVGDGVWGTGGYFYMGKPIPWTWADWARDYNFQGAVGDARVNRAITYDERELQALKDRGFVVEAVIDRATVLSRK